MIEAYTSTTIPNSIDVFKSANAKAIVSWAGRTAKQELKQLKSMVNGLSLSERRVSPLKHYGRR